MIDLETELRGALSDAVQHVPISADPWADYRRHTASKRSRWAAHPRMALGASVAGIAAAIAGIVGGAMALSAGSGSMTVGSDTVAVTLTPSRALSEPALARSARILQRRLRSDGIVHGTVRVSGSALSAQVPLADSAALATMAGTRGRLAVRLALAVGSSPTSGSGARHGSVLLTHATKLNALIKAGYKYWDCSDKSGLDPTGGGYLHQYVVGCSSDGSTKYLLAPTAVVGREISDATAGHVDYVHSTHWGINLSFNAAGSAAFQQVTKQANSVGHDQPLLGCGSPVGCDAIGYVLDGVVQSAPQVLSSPAGITGGRTQIDGPFSRASAVELAAILSHGPLPATFSTAA